MSGFGILILIVLFFWIVGPWIARWMRRKAMEKAEDYMRASMGMPPREKGKKGKSRFTSGYENHNAGGYGNPYTRHQGSRGPIIPKEYAEDVEFIEIKEYSEKEVVKTPEGKEIYHESQVSDVEYVDIKKDSNK